MFSLLIGPVLEQLATLEDHSIDCCVTSPPYWRKRDYGHADQIGQEETPQAFVETLAVVFTEVHRVLKPEGTLWINIDDSYHQGRLTGIPWWFAFELQNRTGFILRSDIIWAKPSCTPEPIKNRPTHSYEHLFLFAAGKQYHYDYNAILEPHTNPWTIDCIRKAQENGTERPKDIDFFDKAARQASGQSGMTRAQFGALMNPNGKNRRDVWSIKAHREKGSRHLAPYPEELVELCIKAGCPEQGVVLDPFTGSGTTGVVALRLNRQFIGIELVQEYAELARTRIEKIIQSDTKAVDSKQT